ncbi:hypothetical protein MIDIC_80014 [Alphaproteobacteria bacterium]
MKFDLKRILARGELGVLKKHTLQRSGFREKRGIFRENIINISK